MLIHLYKCTDEQNKVKKSLQSQTTLMGNLRENCSVLNPQLTIEHEMPLTFNYAHIPDFNRYYYIDEITNIRNRLWLLSLSVDVLMSFSYDILRVPVIVSDALNTDETYMSGSQWQTSVKTKTDILNFPSGLNDTGEYILITSGGVASVG